MMNRAFKLLLSILTVFAVGVRAGDDVQVVGVSDGDTITVLTAEKKQFRVRLHGIDSPEKAQAFGVKAKKHLSSLTFNKTVRLEVVDTDRYGRKVCKVFVGETCVNVAMVEEGYAWHSIRYAPKDKDLRKAQESAKKAGKGLWADKTPTPPWEFRRSKKVAALMAKTKPGESIVYWLNTSSGTRHNNACSYFGKTKKGRSCEKNEGTPCSHCGG